MIARTAAQKLLDLAAQFKAVALTGPRQSGKTTLARAVFENKKYVSLENPTARQFALEDPVGFLAQFPDGAVLDEAQRAPQLFSWLQQNLDDDPRRGKFILSGSNNFLLLEKITQSLAGRVAYLELLPFSVEELLAELPEATASLDDLIWRGSYPAVQAEKMQPEDWHPAYLRTYVERDVRQIRSIENLFLFEKMLALCAGRVGQEVNFTNLSIEVGVDVKTIQAWLGILRSSYIVHFLAPFHQNFNKRIVKAPKLYFWDTGLACSLLRLNDAAMMAQSPFRGPLFENLMVNELLKNRLHRGRRSNLFFWRENRGHEIDVLLDESLQQLPIEIKSGQTIQPKWLDGLRHWSKISGQPLAGTVLFGGSEGQIRSDGLAVRGWREVAAL